MCKIFILSPRHAHHFTFSFADCGPSRPRILMFYTSLEPYFCVVYYLQGFLYIQRYFPPRKAEFLHVNGCSESSGRTSPLRKRTFFNHFRGGKNQPRDKETKSKSRGEYVNNMAEDVFGHLHYYKICKIKIFPISDFTSHTGN